MRLPWRTRNQATEPSIPLAVEVAGQWAWRLLAIIAALVVFGYAIASLEEIVVPFLVSVLVSALLVPFVNLLTRHHVPKWLAIVVALVGLTVIVVGLVVLVVTQIKAGLPNLERRTMMSYDHFRAFLRQPPFSVSDKQFNVYVSQAEAAIRADSKVLLSGALSVGATAGRLLTGGLLALFSTIFLLIDGGGVWRWVVRLFPRRARVAAAGAGQAGWLTLTTFVRVQVFVAAVDAVGIGLFAFFLGLPLVIPIAIVVFLASFIPVVGAIVSGAIAVVVALVFVGPVQAVVMLGGVLVVHLLEAHILQPLVIGTAVRVHPLAVVLSVAGGAYVAGIPGALFAVPAVASVSAMVTYVASGRWRSS